MRWLQAGGWLQNWLKRAKAVLFTHRPRQRPVRYGGREFSAPQPWKNAKLPKAPGLYAIQVKHWWRGLDPIHFGESKDLHEDLKVEGAEGFVHWLMHRGARRGIFISFHTGEDLAHHETRRGESARLLREYFPRRVHSMEEHTDRHRIHRPASWRPRAPCDDTEEGDSIR